jgi:2-polyprenyl-6-methoxyphenol hydroxylase-like FAD-dependent oxidoreductase
VTGNNSISAPLLIVGAGPVGLALAGDLARRGHAVTIIERSDGTIEQPRMDMVGVRTMEFCRRWGIVPAVESSAYNRDLAQDNVYVTSVAGYELSRERFPSMRDSKPPEQSPQKRERCPQDMFDPILRDWARSFPSVEVRYRHQLLDFEQHAEGVTARVLDRDAERTLEIEAPYLIGCDGAGSTVAKAIGGPREGTPALSYTTNIIFRAPQLLSLHDKGEAYRFIIVSTEGTWATIVAINGFDRWRMSIVNTPPEGFTREQIEAAIRRAVGLDFTFEILSINSWTRSELVAASYQDRRVFIAGDAAHVMSPTGGFGMNTGIGDAVDLAWKLDATLRGWGGSELLDSYTVERRPVAVRNGRESSANLARMLSPVPNPVLCDDSPAGAAARAKLGPEFAEAMSKEWYTLGIHLGYRYDDSPICWSDGTPAPPLEVARYIQESRPGARAPHAWLRDGRSTLDLFGDGFVLLRFNKNANPDPIAAALRERNVPLNVVDLTTEPAAIGAYAAGLVLVRPDGHVAWRGTSHPNPAQLADRVRGAVAPVIASAVEGQPQSSLMEKS